MSFKINELIQLGKLDGACLTHTQNSAYHFNPGPDQQKWSWADAKSWCEDHGLELPVFETFDEMHEVWNVRPMNGSNCKINFKIYTS
jgi:hypothetical protein